MAKYTVKYTDSFFEDMEKLDKGVSNRIAKWIDKHLNDVDFPTRPGKVLTGNLGGYVRFRPLKDYRIIALVEDNVLQIICISVGHRSKIYN